MVRAYPQFDPSFTMLLHGLHGDFTRLTPDDLRRIASGTPGRPRTKRACVVNTEVNYGLARMFQSLSAAQGDDFPIALFNNMQDAIRWLGATDA